MDNHDPLKRAAGECSGMPPERQGSAGGTGAPGCPQCCPPGLREEPRTSQDDSFTALALSSPPHRSLAHGPW